MMTEAHDPCRICKKKKKFIVNYGEYEVLNVSLQCKENSTSFNSKNISNRFYDFRYYRWFVFIFFNAA
jgi:hypothetical protein